jgi:ketosteroid isomerase-like protein
MHDVELVKRAVDAFNAADVAAFTALTTADFEWLPSMSPIEAERFLGAEGIERYFALLANAWERFHVLPERLLDHDHGVLLLARLEGRGRSSGATVDAALGMVFDTRDGAISRIRGYLDQEQALKAVGLELGGEV